VTEKELIKACREEDPAAQKALFERYSPKMFALARRYVGSREEAEDVLVEGFFKVLTRLDQYSGEGSFEGWIRRILINEALMHLRRRQPHHAEVELSNLSAGKEPEIEAELSYQELLQLLEQLPEGYRTVFNLYVIEGYKHREIAELLGISINTSKSQLILAKKRMRELIEKRGS